MKKMPGACHFEHEQDRGQDHPVPRPEREERMHGVDRLKALDRGNRTAGADTRRW